MKELPRRLLLLASCFLLGCLFGLPSWYVFCKESPSSASSFSPNENSALANMDENIQEKEETDGSIGTLSLEHTDSSISSYHEECSVDCTKQKESVELGELRMHEVEPQLSVDSNEASLSIAGIPENTFSISTSEISPVSQPNAIENSSADIPVISSVEGEQSEPDCDIGGILEADPQSEPSSLVTSPESLVGQHIENISSHRKGKMTKSEFDPKVAATEQKTDPKSALNASGNVRGEAQIQRERIECLRPAKMTH